MDTDSAALGREVREYADRVVALAEALSRPDAVARLQAEARRWEEERVAVVVAGDIKRGKSSLINALVEHPGLLPVDADVATAVRLVVQYAEVPTATVTRSVDGRPVTEDLPIDRLASVASAQGSDVARKGIVAVTVGVPHPLLASGLTLIDTPGVGGMTPGHRDLTLAALQLTDGLVFVMSAEGPVLRSELEFLAAASERVDNVVLVLTKVDAQKDHAELLAENVSRLEAHAAELERTAGDAADGARALEIARRFRGLLGAPMLPVSARAAARATDRRRQGDEDAAARMAARSGFEPLVAALTGMATSRDLLRMANVVQLATTVLADLAAEQNDRVKAASQDPEIAARVSQEKERSAEFTSGQARWKQRFTLAMQVMQAEVNRSLAREFTGLEAAYRDRIVAGAALGDLATDLQQSTLAVWATVAGIVRDRLQQAVDEIVGELGLERIDVASSDLAPPATLRALDEGRPDDGRSGAPKLDWVDDGIPVVLTSSAFGSLLAAVGIASGPAGWAAGAVVASAIAFARYRRRSSKYSQQEDLRELREAVAAARNDGVGELGTRLPMLRAHVEEEIGARIRELDEEFARRKKELQDLVRESGQRRQKDMDAARAALKKITTLTADGGALRTRVHDARAQ